MLSPEFIALTEKRLWRLYLTRGVEITKKLVDKSKNRTSNTLTTYVENTKEALSSKVKEMSQSVPQNKRDRWMKAHQQAAAWWGQEQRQEECRRRRGLSHHYAKRDMAHHAIVKWQRHCHGRCLEALKDGDIVVETDFAEKHIPPILHQHDDARLPTNNPRGGSRAIQATDALGGRQDAGGGDVDLRV